MKKTLLAAALFTGLTSIAVAETSVTLYGLLDTGIGYNRIKVEDVELKHHSLSRVGPLAGVQSGSHWGFRGVEDICDDWSAIFTIEGGVNSTDGAPKDYRLFGRQITVGISNKFFGKIELGRQSNISSKYFSTIDPFGYGFSQASIGMTMGSVNMRHDNMALYQTPIINGIQMGLGYSFCSDTQDLPSLSDWYTSDNDRAITVGMRYSKGGPLTLAASYDRIIGSNIRGDDAEKDLSSYMLGGSYDLGSIKISSAYSKMSNGWLGMFNAPGYKDVTAMILDRFCFRKGFHADSYMLGMKKSINKSTNIFGSWQKVVIRDKHLPTSLLLTYGNDDQNVYSIGYTYDINKRTNLYAYGSYSTEHLFVKGAKSKSFAVGLRHRF
ncbi:Outer membrane porin protein [Candidatus Kinetoplastibacterium sorsogonicusi]|uniref:Outer membrane porin protein n=1 Tax=Candidatus Kinetoplastidibacterium kentomonadis TaxID=1576550 RepID=A0A3Q8EUH5_9PROT|nr:porin [Candidatus Kinetoplastibacterium sorsogonicusi]AWD32597.1 Outer membrane porin protein [Candidatus Kinetoplastibacterium sorsogonicusi]